VKKQEAFSGQDRRKRSRQGRTLAERRLNYWWELERLGRQVVKEHPELIPHELVEHCAELDDQVEQHTTYLEALRSTIAAEEAGFREYENKFLVRLERERKKRRQLRQRIHRDRADPAEISRQIGLAEEEMAVLERRMHEEEERASGEVTDSLRELRLDRIRRQRKLESMKRDLESARQADAADSDPRLREIDDQIARLEAELHGQEAAIDGRLGEHQNNLELYSERTSALRDDLRDHLIKVGDAVFHHQLGPEVLKTRFERLHRLIREAVK